MKLSVPLPAVINAYLAARADEQQGELANALAVAIGSSWNRSSPRAKGLYRFMQMPHGTVIPFNLGMSDIDIACLCAANLEQGLIYSNNSLTTAGAIGISGDECVYLDSWFDPTQQPANFSITPRQAAQLQSAILQRASPEVSVSIENVVTIKVHFYRQRPPSGDDWRHRDLKVEIFNPTKAKASAQPFKNVHASYHFPTQTLQVSASSPEAILQLSAYGNEGMWMTVSSDSVPVCFAIPSLDDQNPHEKVWAADWLFTNDYVDIKRMVNVQVPLDTAVQCALAYRWFYIHHPTFSRQIAREAVRN